MNAIREDQRDFAANFAASQYRVGTAGKLASPDLAPRTGFERRSLDCALFTRRRTKQNGNIRTPKNRKKALNKEKNKNSRM